ncbi:MAG TPA: S41 family peptidase [Candidatus Angelobacter sp.]|nr:S41 family peptidase [Candidatus Angelobacter sp.]
MSTPTPPIHRARRAALVVGLVAAAYAGGVVTGVVGSREPAPTAASSSSGVLDEAASRIMADAARPVSRQQLDQAAVEGMLKALGDRWSAYYKQSDFSSFQAGLDGRYSGVGIWLRSTQDGQVYVASVQPGSPASSAGLLAGDRLTAVNGAEVAAEPLATVAATLRGKVGSTVPIELTRDGEALSVVVTRGALASDDVVVTRLKGGVEVVRIAAFTRGVGSAVRKAIASTDQGPTTGVVLDLRSNPGGLLTEAVEVASAFLDGGAVVSYEKRGEPIQHLDAIAGGNTSVPLVVLVDEGTASAAEVVAGALQDRNRAVIVGSRTYGKGSIQEPTELSDGSALELTVGRYLTPAGRSLDGVGIDPDVLVSAKAGSAAAEQRALEVLRGLVAASEYAARG